jgi:hypothetical protein
MKSEVLCGKYDVTKERLLGWKVIAKDLYDTLELCIDSFAIADKNLDFVVHELEIGDDVEPDIHGVDERVVANNWKFKIIIGDKRYTYTADGKKWYVIFHIPWGIKHSLKTIEKTKYYVFKEKQ